MASERAIETPVRRRWVVLGIGMACPECVPEFLEKYGLPPVGSPFPYASIDLILSHYETPEPLGDGYSWAISASYRMRAAIEAERKMVEDNPKLARVLRV